MGKRELLIIIAFVAVGVVAYQVTAPAPKAGEHGFSLSRFFSGIRREIGSHATSASVTKTGVIKVGPGITELRVSTFRSVPVTIIGDARADVAYELPVESTGPDEATARAWADKAELLRDDLGTALSIRLYFPPEGTQNAKLTLRVPSGLAVRVEDSGRIQVDKVAALELRNVAGETTVSGVTGAVTGSHRSGELKVTGAGSVDLTLASSRATFRDVTGGLTLNARNGDCSVAGSRGPLDASMANVEFDITDHMGSIKVGGENGRLKVTLPRRDVAVDVRRMLVEVALGASGPVTIITTEEPLRLFLGDALSLAIDAATTNGGEIRAAEFGWQPTTAERDSRLSASLGAGATRVVLRNSRGDIEIGHRK